MLGNNSNEKNLLQYNLTKDDILYFLHIPKTAGTSLIFILNNYFNNDSILYAQEWGHLSKNKPKDFSKFQLVKGHFGYAVYRILPKKPLYITMLRNPKDVIISNLRMLKRQPPDAKKYHISSNDSISDLILRPTIRGLKNPLCLWLNCDLDVPSLTKDLDPKLLEGFFLADQPAFMLSGLSDEKIIQTAKQHLLECVFFGLAERFEDSLILLHYIFGWRPYRYSIKLNISPNENLEELSSEANDELVKRTKLDEELYKFAQQLFDKRYSQMIQCLREKYYEPSFNKICPKDVIYELLEKHYKERFLESHQPLSSIYYTFDQKISGTGWHQREQNPISKNIFRWTGPEKISTIDFALLSKKDLKIQFHVIDRMASDILGSIQLKVNESSCELNFFEDMDYKKGGKFETKVSKSMLNYDNNFCRLTFQINRTISPVSVNPNSTDKRKLGILMDWIKISQIQ